VTPGGTSEKLDVAERRTRGYLDRTEALEAAGLEA
jgi:hypothetical protein